MFFTQKILVGLIVFAKYSISLNPNFVFILTDDQDLSLGGVKPLKKVRTLIEKNGMTFSNMFVTTPLCCPSRASILTGKYAHNHGVVNNSVNGNCNSFLWQKREEPRTFVSYLKRAGYSTFHAGKYLNQYGKPSSGGVRHIPPGWDHWMTLVGNSVYYNYSLSVNGKKVHHGFDYKEDYLTDVIAREAETFLHHYNKSTPFLMFLSFPAPHSPFTSAPQYQSHFANVTAPRTPSFNIHAKLKHWLLQQPPSPLPETVINNIDEVYRKRWQTLLSVDDAVETIVQVLEKRKMLDNTYIFFTSDNGFHFGQFSLPWDKRQPYEFDVRVPLFVRGPNVQPGRTCKAPVLNIDIASTILDLAGLPVPPQFDGRSFAYDLLAFSNVSSEKHRSNFLIEHQGEASSIPIPGCSQYRPGEVHTCEIDCICEDSWNNTYTCVRELSVSENSLACFFRYENFTEVYDMTEDPFQLYNLAYSRNSIHYFNSSKKLFRGNNLV